jgi:hypothetical protein
LVYKLPYAPPHADYEQSGIVIAQKELAVSVASWAIVASSPALISAANEEGGWNAIGRCLGEEN